VARDFAVRFERVALMAAIARGPALATLGQRQARSAFEFDKQNGGAIQRRRVSKTAEYQRVCPRSVCPRSV
jgi:hypothetical protein